MALGPFKSLPQRVWKSEIGHRIASGALWSIFGTATAKFFVLAAGIICARILGSAGYGELGLVRSTISMFVVFGTAGMGVTAAKHIAQYRKSNPVEAGKIYLITIIFGLISAFVVSVIIFFLAPELIKADLNTRSLQLDIQIGIVILFASIVNGAVSGNLAGFEAFKTISINGFISSFVETVLIIAGAFYFGVTGAVLGYGIGMASLLLLNYISSKKLLHKNNIFPKLTSLQGKDFKILYKFSLPAALSSFLVAPVYWVVRTMLINFNGFSQLGVYEAADQWRMIILFVPSALSQIILPILSSKLGEGSQRDYWKVLKYNLWLNGGITFLLATGVVVLAPFIMQLYGKGFDNPLIVSILAYSTVMSSLAAVIGLCIVSRGKVWTGLGFNIGWAFMFAGGTYLALFYGLGIIGVGLALFASYTVHTISQMVYLWYVYKKES